MNKEKILPIVKGSIKHIPGVKKLLPNKTGGTIESRYCYSVWLRHLLYWHKVKHCVPETIAELGPGDSLGIGLSALLSGSKKLFALDVIKYWNPKRNLLIFEELVVLFKNKTDIPNNQEYPNIIPKLDDYSFPESILSEDVLKESLADERLDDIRKEILNIDNSNNSFISYQIPWYDNKIIHKNSIDFIFSQAVLEHVVDLGNTYEAMNKWTKSDGLISHAIDFKSHGVTKSWNGHWLFSNFEWSIVKGGKSFLINRQALSEHTKLHKVYGFKILVKSIVKMKSRLKRSQLSKKFRKLSKEDITTSSAYILSKKVFVLNLLKMSIPEFEMIY